MDPNWSHYACSVVRWVNREVGPGNPEQGVTKVFFSHITKICNKRFILNRKTFWHAKWHCSADNLFWILPLCFYFYSNLKCHLVSSPCSFSIIFLRLLTYHDWVKYRSWYVLHSFLILNLDNLLTIFDSHQAKLILQLLFLLNFYSN